MRNKLFTLLIALPLLALSAAAFAQTSPVGSWTTIDDKTKKPKSVVEIYETTNGSLAARVAEILHSDRGPNPVCDKCKDDRKNKPITGMEIIRGMKAEGGGEYAGGTILKPDEGKVYKSKMELVDGGKKLEVSGCIAFICKSQTWIRQ